MNTPTTRDFLRRPDVVRRRSARQALAVIPNDTSSTLSPGEALQIEVNAMDNFLNSRHSSDSWSPAPSPDEQVIQKRGRRRRTIVWSPDVDTCKRNSLLSLSSRERTPVKSPTRSNMILRSTPRKRLSLGDPDETQLKTPEKKKPQNTMDMNASKEFNGILLKGLRALSHEQLVKMIMDLVSMQGNGALNEGEMLRTVLLKRMPVPDIRPLINMLTDIIQQIHACVQSSNHDDVVFSRSYGLLDTFQEAIVDHGKTLAEVQQWTALMQYVCTAWNITKKLQEWNPLFNSESRKSFNSLTQFCLQALKKGIFTGAALDMYAHRVNDMVADYEDIKICLKLLNEMKHNDT